MLPVKTSANMSSSLEWQMISLNTPHKHPKPTVTNVLHHCLSGLVLTAYRQERLRSVLLGTWQLAPYLHIYSRLQTKHVDSDVMHPLLFYLIFFRVT